MVDCRKGLLALIALGFLASFADAGWRRQQRRGGWQQQEVQRPVETASTSTEPAVVGEESEDALDEVNAARSRQGLHLFRRDAGLTRAALSCARHRAVNLIAGHVDDFSHLPEGSSAGAAGCAAWPGNDWGSCCTYESWTYAGAAWVRGRDGRRYMHLFVR